jgi:rhodanese-related sulfurtransferase
MMFLKKYNNKTKQTNKVLTIIIIIIICAAILYYLNKRNKLKKVEITLEKANEMLKMYQVDYLIDVREQDEYEHIHYPGAHNVPLSLLRNNLSLKDVPNLKDIHAESKILLYCDSGNKARNAANILLNQGYEKVNYINGNIMKLLKMN